MKDEDFLFHPQATHNVELFSPRSFLRYDLKWMNANSLVFVCWAKDNENQMKWEWKRIKRKPSESSKSASLDCEGGKLTVLVKYIFVFVHQHNKTFSCIRESIFSIFLRSQIFPSTMKTFSQNKFSWQWHEDHNQDEAVAEASESVCAPHCIGDFRFFYVRPRITYSFGLVAKSPQHSSILRKKNERFLFSCVQSLIQSRKKRKRKGKKALWK